MIRLHAHPLPPLSREQVVYISQSSSVWPVEHTDGGRGGGGNGVVEEPNRTITRKPGPLQIIQYSLAEGMWD
jgi:hypothetical protein